MEQVNRKRKQATAKSRCCETARGISALALQLELDPKEFKQLEQARDKFRREFGKRKQICLRLIDGIMEGYTKPKQQLIADSEIVTDEAAGFDINRYK
jgi:hypothetical protein